MAKHLSRRERLADIVAAIESAAIDLYELKYEYEQWLDGMEDNEGLSQTATADKLRDVVDELTNAESVINDLPLGFGRD